MPSQQPPPSLIVVGEMNTDIVISGLPHFPKSGELVNGDELCIGPGGKSRNIAAMASVLMPQGSVAMISKTTKDRFGLWEEPLKALQQAGVDTRFVHVAAHSAANELPGFAVILVDKAGNNQIIGAPGVNRAFSPEDIDHASELFGTVGENHGLLACTGCSPISTLGRAIQKARTQDISVVFDPGGADDLKALVSLLHHGVYLCKPNEHEAQVMTGVPVTDFVSAKTAARMLQEAGAQNVLITAGAHGAYLFSANAEKHIPVSTTLNSNVKDETGCGDQTMATLCAYIQAGRSLEESTDIAILSATLQFHKAGIQPVTKDELEALST